MANLADNIAAPLPDEGTLPASSVTPAAKLSDEGTLPASTLRLPDEGTLPLPDEGTLSADTAVQNHTQNDEGTLARLADHVKQAVMGKGTFLGTSTGPGTGITDVFKQPWGETVQKNEAGIKQLWEDTSAIIPFNSADPDWAANHPHEAAAAKGLSSAVQGLTTPGSISLILGTSGMGALPKALEETLSASEATAPYAAKAATVARRALQGVGAYFTYDQIKAAGEAVPGIWQAIATGQTDKAIELTTGALVNATMGGLAGTHTLGDIREYNAEKAKTSALKDPEYSGEIHRRGGDFSVGGGMQDMVKQITGKPNWQDTEKRRALSHRLEANEDPKVLAQRQKEAATAPPTVDQTAQGPQVPFEENKPVATNGSGESAASQEAVNRVQTEKANGIQRYRVDTRSGVETPIANTADAVDLKAQPFEEIRQRGPEGDTLLDRGDNAKPFTPKPFTPKPAEAAPAGEKEAGVHDLGDLSEKSEDDKLGFKSAFESAKGAATDSFIRDAWDRLSNGKNLLFSDKPGTQENKIQAAFDAGKIKSADDIRALIVPEKAPLKITTDNNGIRYANTPDNPAPADVSIPKSMTDEAEIDKYVREKLDLQKQFAESRKPQTPKPVFTSATETNANAAPVTEEEESVEGDKTQSHEEKTTIPQEEVDSPVGQHILELRAALKDAADAAKAHVITPEERAERVRLLDPKRKFSAEDQKDIDTVKGMVQRLGQEAVKRGLLKKGQLRGNYVPHEFPFEDKTNPTRARLYDTLHDAYQAGLLPSNDDYFALAHDYIGKMTRMINDFDTAANLKKGRGLSGRPLAVSSGFVEGQRVAADRPQSYIMSDDEVKKLTKDGRLAKLIRAGHVEQNPDKSFTMKADDFVKSDGLHELRPIGPTPIPPNILASMKEDGSLDALLKKDLIYQNDKGEYITKEPLYARTPLYINPEQAPHFNGAVIPSTPTPNGVLGKLGQGYDYLAGNMKSLLLSWSPFHRVQEGLRALRGMGVLNGKGPKLVGMQLAGRIPDIDYNNLTPSQAAAIRDGITNGVDPRGGRESMVGEGLGAGGEKNWGAKTYKIFNTVMDKVLKTSGMSDDLRSKVLSKIDPEKILTKGLFGPQGQITKYKMALYDDKKPQIAEQIAKDHPDWSPEKVQMHAGRMAAQFANNLFGGQNLPLIGRALSDQKWARRLLLAPDFLESTGRSITDIGNKYGSDLAAKFIEFNLLHAGASAAINYAIHHDPNDHSAKGALDASHIMDHPFSVVSPDGKTVYGLRTELADFLRLLDQPREFISDRVNPLARAATEAYFKKNQYGRTETQAEALKAIPKAALPIQIQNAVGLGPNTTTEPSAADQFMKSLGIQARPNRTPAEQLAISKVSARLQGEEARSGAALARSQMKFNIEDKLRAAYAIKDPEKKKAALAAAKQDLQMLASRKIVDPESAKKIIVDAQGSRLKSIVVHLGPEDALDIWDKASDQEKEELGAAMHAHYATWVDKMSKEGQNVGSLDVDNQKTFDRFRNAMSQLADIREREANKPEEGTIPANELTPSPEPQPEAAAPSEPRPPAIVAPKRIAPIIDHVAQKYGISAQLVGAIIKQESAFNANALSPKGAMGLMQLLPSTASDYGVKDPYDPSQNIEAGAHYMADLLKRYGGDEKKALAAYNAGPENVDKYDGVPPFKETRNYVKSIQNRPLDDEGTLTPEQLKGAR